MNRKKYYVKGITYNGVPIRETIYARSLKQSILFFKILYKLSNFEVILTISNKRVYHEYENESNLHYPLFQNNEKWKIKI